MSQIPIYDQLRVDSLPTPPDGGHPEQRTMLSGSDSVMAASPVVRELSLVCGTPERLALQVLSAFCDILGLP